MDGKSWEWRYQITDFADFADYADYADRGNAMNAYWKTMVADAFDRADRHKPQDRDTLRVAAVELRQRGLTAHDIAAALRLSEQAVAELLGEHREAAP